MMEVHPIRGETQGRQDARMQDGLDGPQVRSLLNAVRGGEVHAGDDGPQLFTLRPPPAGRINVEAHDFRRPDRLGKEALRAIQTIQQRLAQEPGAAVDWVLGQFGEFPAQSMEQTTWADYSDKLPRLTSFVLFRSKGFDTPFFFNLPPKVFYAMLDRLLGGGDQSDLVIPKREPTSIEKQIRAMLIKHMGEALTAAWSVLPTPGFQDESKVESDPKMAPGLAPNEVVVEVTFAFRMSGRGEVSLAIPIRALEPHLDGLVEVLSGGVGVFPTRPRKDVWISVYAPFRSRERRSWGPPASPLVNSKAWRSVMCWTWIKSSHPSPWAVVRPGRCTWAIGEIAESFALVRPHKHQISMIFGRMVPSPPDGLGSICIGSSPPCANGVLTFDPSAMPAEPGWDCRRSLVVLRPGEVRMI